MRITHLADTSTVVQTAHRAIEIIRRAPHRTATTSGGLMQAKNSQSAVTRPRWLGWLAVLAGCAMSMLASGPAWAQPVSSHAAAQVGTSDPRVQPATLSGGSNIKNGNGGRCLDADIFTIPNNGTKIQLWDCFASRPANQTWTLTPTPEPDVYQIRTQFNDKCLDADANTIGHNGTKVQLWDCRGLSANQLWIVRPTQFGGIFHLVNLQSNRCLDADLFTISNNGTRIQLWDCGGDFQSWQNWIFN
jgi:hypothetical protein